MLHNSPSRVVQESLRLCPSCAIRLRTLNSTGQRRSITQQHIEKILEAKLEWARQSTEIKAGRKESMLTLLEKRGYVNQIVG